MQHLSMTYQVILLDQEIQEDPWAQGLQKTGFQVVLEVREYQVFQAHLNKERSVRFLTILLKRFPDIHRPSDYL